MGPLDTSAGPGSLDVDPRGSTAEADGAARSRMRGFGGTCFGLPPSPPRRGALIVVEVIEVVEVVEIAFVEGRVDRGGGAGDSYFARVDWPRVVGVVGPRVECRPVLVVILVGLFDLSNVALGVVGLGVVDEEVFLERVEVLAGEDGFAALLLELFGLLGGELFLEDARRLVGLPFLKGLGRDLRRRDSDLGPTNARGALSLVRRTNERGTQRTRGRAGVPFWPLALSSARFFSIRCSSVSSPPSAVWPAFASSDSAQASS